MLLDTFIQDSIQNSLPHTMKKSKRLLLSLLLLTQFTVAFAESKYDIAEVYSVSKPESGSKAVGKYDKTIDVEYILTPTKIDTGKYSVEVRKIGDNLYQIKNSDICVETRYCHEWASFSKEAILIIDSKYGYTKGKNMFE